MTEKASVQDKLIQRVRTRAGKGRRVFVPRDFLDLGSRDAVDQALSRLARAGTIRRLRRGVYDYPKTHPRLGPLTPSAHEIASAIARSTGHAIQVSGAHAANALGLSSQVPAQTVYLTDGTSRIVKVGNRTITFRHSNQLAGAVTTVGTIIQALRYIGRGSEIADDVTEKIRAGLSDSQLRSLRKHMGDVSQRVARELQRLVRLPRFGGQVD